MHRHSLAVLTVSLLLAPGAAQEPSAQPSSWNQWRGPDRTGQVGGKAWPSRLTAKTLNRKWRVEAAPSYSGPVLDAKRVYTTATVAKKFEEVRAHDRHTGELVWKARWEGAMSVPFFARRNGSWIRSTPTLAGDSLYVAGMRDVLVCLATDSGEERWRVDFTERFETPVESFGFVCSPLVHDGSVYVQTAAGLVKLDAKTGETQWRSLKERGGMFGGAFSSPVMAELAGHDQLLVQTRTALTGVRPADGTVLWKKTIRSFRGMNILTPLAHGNGVFTSAYGGRGHFFEIAKGESDGKSTATKKWQNRTQAYMTSPVVVDGHAYLYLRSKRFSCVNLETGEVTWTSKPVGDEYWSLVAQGNRILALTNAGELYLIRANPTEFQVIDKVRVADSQTWAHLAVDDGQLFIREQDGLSAYAWRDAAPERRRVIVKR